jgi:GNAT superfamily N-acetyltransferase
VILELVPPETGRAYAAMCELRQDLTDEAAFVRHVDEVQRPEGYRLAGAVVGDEVVAVSGFRLGHNLAWGRHLYVDDLSTAAVARGQGHARELLTWLVEEGRRLRCGAIHLDSGVGANRADAHRLYLSAGFRITSHHFCIVL